MGYVNDPEMVQWIPPNHVIKSAGTWTSTLSSNTVADVRAAAAAAFSLYIPVEVPSNAAGLKGAQLVSIDVLYKVGTAALTSVLTVELEKVTFTAAGAATGSAVAVTVDSLHDTTAKRVSVADHCMTVALNTPAWVGKNDVYWLQVAAVAAATSLVTLWGARANFVLRV